MSKRRKKRISPHIPLNVGGLLGKGRWVASAADEGGRLAVSDSCSGIRIRVRCVIERSLVFLIGIVLSLSVERPQILLNSSARRVVDWIASATSPRGSLCEGISKAFQSARSAFVLEVAL